MIFGNDRMELRRMYKEAWQKSRRGLPLTPLESQIAGVVERHPEYHKEVRTDALARDFTPEDGQTNPFLHMGLHLAIGDQVATDRPAGIRREYARLCATLGDNHAAEHRLLDCLGECLWNAQRAGLPPDEERYLELVRSIV